MVVGLTGILVDIKQLTDLVKLLRKLGVQIYRTPQLELVLTDKLQPKKYKDSKEPSSLSDWDKLTDEEKLMWSSQPHVGAE